MRCVMPVSSSNHILYGIVLIMMANTKERGFTLVELLIVIVVIAILAAITIVAYNGIQMRATNAARMQELVQWKKHFELYKVTYGAYPAMTTGETYCLGQGFTGGVCQNSSGPNAWPESASDPLLDELRKIGTLPEGPRTRIANFGAPYVRYQAGQLLMVGMVQDQASHCAEGTDVVETYHPLILCRFSLPL